MKKLFGKKMNMSQVWKNDVVVPVSIIQLEAESDLAELKEGDLVKVSGITRSLGHQGVVKRHGFHGGPQTHGAKNRIRASGSIGNTSPQRVIPGRKMAGRMGGIRQTTKNLKVVDINAEKKVIMIRGAVPGYNKRSRLEIAK